MKILNKNIDLETFFADLKQTPSNILFLDYDGTLAPFNTDPAKAVPYQGIRERLARLLDCSNTRLVIITGRYTRDIIPLLNLQEIPEIWGSHGLERLRPDGKYEVEQFNEQTRDYLVQAREIAGALIGEARLEEKPGCVALHWRGLQPEIIDQIVRRISPHWEKISREGNLEFKKFDGGLEIRVPGKDKGNAVRQILKEMPPESMSAYLGDDLTDEDAFAALGERGLSVLVRQEFRSTQADLWIEPPEELFDFINQWLEACH